MLKKYAIIYIDNRERSTTTMSSNLNEIAAAQLLLQFIPLKDLITAAMHSFAEGNSVKDKENADLCYKAIEAFLSK